MPMTELEWILAADLRTLTWVSRMLRELHLGSNPHVPKQELAVVARITDRWLDALYAATRPTPDAPPPPPSPSGPEVA